MLVTTYKYNIVNHSDRIINIDNLINISPYASITINENTYNELIKLDYFNKLIKQERTLSCFRYETKNIVLSNTTIKETNTTNNIKTRKRKSTKSKQNSSNITKDNVDQ